MVENDRGLRILKEMTLAKRAFLLINVSSWESDEELSSSNVVNDILSSISQINGVVLAQAVTGVYDIIAIIETDNLAEIGNIVTEKIGCISGIENWEICIGIKKPLGRLVYKLALMNKSP
ncbi:MAG: Lrp/AsnC family transcriptional regulator [Dehalococcoidales bacterium]|nr:Lrp/AsnC family transcriptional regulator [Dehalococcoidales bacterium]